MWAVPALVLGDPMARPVSTLLEVEQFFGGAKEQYHARGISDTGRKSWICVAHPAR